MLLSFWDAQTHRPGPVELGQSLFEGAGELLLPDGTVAAEAKGKYIKLPLEKVADFDAEREEWRVAPDEGDV